MKNITVVQQDEEQEGHAGDIEILWSYSSQQVGNDSWFKGQFEVRAHNYDDISQNYTVSERIVWLKTIFFVLVKNCC